MNRKIRIATAALVAALSVAVVIAAAPANAALGSMSASLAVSPGPSWGPCTYDVVVSGVVRTSSYLEALQLRYSTWFLIKLWGDDSFSDDFLYGPGPDGVSYDPRSDGLYFSKSFRVYCSTLNEDISRVDNHDEVYAGVRLMANGSGSTIRSAESNRVYGYF
jgi:hypothetical protein